MRRGGRASTTARSSDISDTSRELTEGQRNTNKLGTVNLEIPLHIPCVFIFRALFYCRVLFSGSGFIATTSYVITTRHKTKQWLSQHSICWINSHLGTLSVETERTGEKRQPKLSHFSTVGNRMGVGLKPPFRKRNHEGGVSSVLGYFHE